MTEAAPGQVLVDAHVLVIEGKGGFKGAFGLLEVFLFFVKETDFDQRVYFLFYGEGRGQDGVLEEFTGLVYLIRLGKDCTELVEDL